MFRPYRLLLIVVLLLMGLSPLQANAQNEQDAAAFAELDGNEDGRLSGTEMSGIEKYDVNGDRRITREEFLEGKAKERPTNPTKDDAKFFAERDVNEDGWLSGRETKGLEAFDTDSDGEVTKEEFLAGRAAMRKPTMSREQLQAAAEKEFLDLDITEDGTLSGTEKRTVVAFDIDGNGRVTKDEFVTGYLKQKGAGDSSEGNYGPETVAEAVKRGSADWVLTQMSPELKALVDPPVLQFMLNMTVEKLGDPLDRPTSVDKATEKDTVSHVISIPYEKGNLEIRVTFQKGLLVAFSLNSDKFTDIPKQLGSQLMTNEAFGKAVANFYAQRGEEIIKLVYAGKDQQAYELFHPIMRKQIPLERAQQQFKAAREHGTLEAIEYESITTSVDAKGDFERTTLTYNLSTDKGPISADIQLTFAGYQGAIVGFATVKQTKLDEPASPTKPKKPADDDDDDAPSAKAKWHEVKVAKHKLAFEMPVKPEHETDADGTETYTVQLEAGKVGLQARIMKHEANVEAGAETFFKAYLDGLKKNMKGTLVDHDEEDLAGHPGKILLFKLPNGSLYAVRAILVGDHSFEFETFLMKPSDEGELIGERFLESPKLSAGKGQAAEEDSDE